ncbi:MAG: HEAT repeat domain-containing protein [Planctomycetes bacterium]|nr:HEAT repeat domain-containing protein [Planctomycetota bacterium]
MIGISFQVSLALAAVPYREPAETKAKPPDLAKAIASLRHIDEGKLTEAQKTKKGAEIQAAWAALVGAGQQGALALKREIETVDKAREKDDFFKLGAAALLWQIGKLDEADAIAKVWAATPLDAQYNYVFYTAFEAAQTQDPRVLPMLKACLRDRKGSVFLEQHMLDVKWPLTHAFLWGPFGPKGLPALHEVLANSGDQVERLSALCILGRMHYLPALATIRKLAADKDDGVRRTAIQMLGFFGHPQDYDFLIAGLSAKDPEEVYAHAFALLEYEDLRAVPHLIPLLKSDNQKLRYEAVGALRHLLMPAALEALHGQAAAAKGKKEKEAISNSVGDILKELGLTWEAYAAKPRRRERPCSGPFARRRRNPTSSTRATASCPTTSSSRPPKSGGSVAHSQGATPTRGCMIATSWPPRRQRTWTCCWTSRRSSIGVSPTSVSTKLTPSTSS